MPVFFIALRPTLLSCAGNVTSDIIVGGTGAMIMVINPDIPVTPAKLRSI